MSAQPHDTVAKDVTFWVEFIGDRSIKVRSGQTVLDASLAAGIPHYHVCGGNGECSTCRILVQGGSEFLSPPSEKENLLKKTIPLPDNVRLACQAVVQGGPVYVHRIIRDDKDLRFYLSATFNDHEQLVGHGQELALFFLDIRDFTPFMESSLPFDVIHIVRRLFGLFRKGIEENYGRIIDTAGDGFYAVFGFDTDVNQAAAQAFRAALTILEELEEFNQHYAEKYFFHRFETGIGLHAGQVIVGDIGIGVNSNLTVMGLPVNIASRIQGATKVLNNNLVVSAAFYGLLHPPPPSQRVRIHLKGITEDYALHLCGKPFQNVRRET